MKAQVTVEIDILSGMSNPGWTLSEADAAVFLSKVDGLQPTAVGAKSIILGYRGLVVRMSHKPSQTMFVWNGVELSDGKSRSFFHDPQRSLERWLIGTGRGFLSPAICEAVDKDLQR